MATPEQVKGEIDKLTRYYAPNESTGDIVHYPEGKRPQCRRWIAACKCILDEHDDDRHECSCGGRWCATEDDDMNRVDPEWMRLPRPILGGLFGWGWGDNDD